MGIAEADILVFFFLQHTKPRSGDGRSKVPWELPDQMTMSTSSWLLKNLLVVSRLV